MFVSFSRSNLGSVEMEARFGDPMLIAFSRAIQEAVGYRAVGGFGDVFGEFPGFGGEDGERVDLRSGFGYEFVTLRCFGLPEPWAGC
jgi:hypothetical protein